jgi:hypothetical protein
MREERRKMLLDSHGGIGVRGGDVGAGATKATEKARARLIDKLWYRRVLWVLRGLLLIAAVAVWIAGEGDLVDLAIGCALWWFVIQGLLWLVVKGVMTFPQKGVVDE